MKVRLFFFYLLIVFTACNKKTNVPKQDFATINNKKEIVVINPLEVEKDSLILDGNKGVWYYKNKPFSGFAVRFFKDQNIQEKIGFYNGKKEGVAKLWFANGNLKLESHYTKNKLIGSYKSWWENGVLASEIYYKEGKKHGVEKRWYPTGVLAKERNLVNGFEEGLQKAWLQNGKLYVNYEAKNGRIFGMRRANSCYQLENEVVIRN